MKRLPLILTACALVATAQAAGQEKITLKHKYTPGTYVVTTAMQMDMVMQMSAATVPPQSSRMQMLMVCEMTVGRPDPKGQKIEVAYKRIRQSVAGGAMSHVYDSADPQQQQGGASSPLAAGYRAVLDTKITMTVAPDGKIADVSGMDAMWEKLAQTSPGAALVMQGLKEQLGDQMFNQMVAPGAEYLPRGPVAKGESWTVQRQQPLPMIGPMTMKQECTLKDVQGTPAGKVAVIGFTGKASKADAATQPAASPLPMQFEKLDFSQSGTMRMNVDLGMMTDMDIKQVMAMTTSMAPPDQERVTMSMKGDGTTKITVRPGKYVPPTTLPAREK